MSNKYRRTTDDCSSVSQARKMHRKLQLGRAKSTAVTLKIVLALFCVSMASPFRRGTANHRLSCFLSSRYTNMRSIERPSGGPPLKLVLYHSLPLLGRGSILCVAPAIIFDICQLMISRVRKQGSATTTEADMAPPKACWTCGCHGLDGCIHRNKK